jgi:hypothetical protein
METYIRDLNISSLLFPVDLDSELEYLSLVEQSNDYYQSRAVFSGKETGVEVKTYPNFDLYEWHCPVTFSELIEAVEPLYPLSQDPALEMIREKGYERNSRDDHVTMSNELVYDPIREWRNDKDESRWSEYSLIQMNLTETKVVWDQKQAGRESRIRIYALDKTSDVFTDIFSELVDKQDVEGIVDDVSEFF